MTTDLNMNPVRKEEIGASLIFAFLQIEEYMLGMTPETFATSMQGKWSPGQQLQHLITSASIVALSMQLPKQAFILFGKSNQSRSYEEIAELYLQSLGKGAKASIAFQPSKINSPKKDPLLRQWKRVLENFKSALYLEWDENDLDTYRMPHPILGKLTVREMLFFTIYHTLYHLNSMKKVYG